MAQNAGEFDNGIAEIREARDQAQILRDQLVAEFERLNEEDKHLPADERENPRRIQGRETMGKAVRAADRAIASIDQALRELQRVRDENGPL